MSILSLWLETSFAAVLWLTMDMDITLLLHERERYLEQCPGWEGVSHPSCYYQLFQSRLLKVKWKSSKLWEFIFTNVCVYRDFQIQVLFLLQLVWLQRPWLCWSTRFPRVALNLNSLWLYLSGWIWLCVKNVNSSRTQRFWQKFRASFHRSLPHTVCLQIQCCSKPSFKFLSVIFSTCPSNIQTDQKVVDLVS